MNNSETLRSPELENPQSASVYEAIVAINPERNPAFTAIEQIKGAKLAELFLKGYADKMSTDAPEEFEGGKTTPLDTALANMRYIAGCYVGGENAGRRGEMLKPWLTAYEALTQ